MPEHRFRIEKALIDAGLPPPDAETMSALWQVVDEGVLGASRHVEIAHAMLARTARADDPDAAWQATRIIADLVADIRGAGAPVVANAIRWQMAGLDELPPQERIARIAERAEEWRSQAAERLRALVERAAATLSTARGVLAYDYSSTVAAVVAAVHAAHPGLVVVVPESRAIAGGKRYLDAFLPAGIGVRYVLDAAFEHVLGDVDAVLLGAESLRADGSFTNTIGSRPLARIATSLGVPVYGCADSFKLDLRSYRGEPPAPAPRDFDDVLLRSLELPAGASVDTRTPELEVVPAAFVTAILTDAGPVPPAAVWALGRELFAEARA